MDKLKNYIRFGKPVSAKKLFFAFFGIAVLVSCTVCGLLFLSLNGADTISSVREFPTIRIQDGTVLEPADKVWTKSFPDIKTVIRIDTTRDRPEVTSSNGFFLSRKQALMVTADRVEELPLPTEPVTIDADFLLRLLRDGIGNLSVILGVFCLISLLLGYWGTVALTYLVLIIMGRPRNADTIRRSALVGWLLILISDIILILTGHGFSLISALIAATAVSLLCVLYPTNTASADRD